MQNSNKIIIDNIAILHNLSVVKKYASASKVMAMIKANAFGHGLLNVARLLSSNADALGVARYDEAIELLNEKLQIPIVLMSGEIDSLRLLKLIELGCELVVSSQIQLEKLVKIKTNYQATIWLKINTGMNRLGISASEADDCIDQLQSCRSVKNIILMTHLSDSDKFQNEKTIQQCNRLIDIGKRHSLPLSMANSASILQYPEFNSDWVRPGIMLYGASPIADKDPSCFDLKPTMILSSYLLDVRRQYKGDEIGYESKWICEKDILLGVIPLGYGDGYPRNIRPNTPVWINGAYCPVIGNVSMDLITIDLTNCSGAKIGDTVELWGKNVSINEIAKCAQTIPNELMTHISPRLISSYINSEDLYAEKISS